MHKNRRQGRVLARVLAEEINNVIPAAALGNAAAAGTVMATEPTRQGQNWDITNEGADGDAD
jgi:hypothetical protein